MMDKFAALLRVKPSPNAEAVVNARLVGIGLGDTCSRCGGTGHHSFNQQHGTVCYGCNGAGRIAPKLTAATLTAAKTAVANGALEAYFEGCRRKARLGKSIAITYDALRDITGDEYHTLNHIADTVNHIALCATTTKDPARRVALEARFQTEMDSFLAQVAAVKDKE